MALPLLLRRAYRAIHTHGRCCFTTQPAAHVAAGDGDAADAVIIGAGIAGLASAYHLARLWSSSSHQGPRKRIVLVDRAPPMSLTSAMSTECYRNFWPAEPHMVALMNRSIDTMHSVAAASAGSLSLKQHGYLFVSQDERQIDDLKNLARQVLHEP